MRLEVCKKCGRVFVYNGLNSKFCNSCIDIDLENFDKVRTYLRENGHANMFEVSEATGVSQDDITRYLRESRLEIPDDSPVFIKCETCGCDIKSGRYCKDCAVRLSKDLKGALVEVGDKPRPLAGKMRFIKTKNDHPLIKKKNPEPEKNE